MSTASNFVRASVLQRVLLHSALLFVTPATRMLKQVYDYRAIYRDFMDVAPAKAVNYTQNIHFSYVPPHSETRLLHKNITSSDGSKVTDRTACVHDDTKLIALYLPGIDGAGLSAQTQFPALSEAFELWRMTVDPTDRSYFADLVNNVVRFIDDVTLANVADDGSHRRKVLLIGESFGGVLAPVAALRKKNRIIGLILINPALAFHSTRWSTVAPLLTTLPHEKEIKRPTDDASVRLPTLYSVVGSMAIALSDMKTFRGIYSDVRERFSGRISVRDFFQALQQGFQLVEGMLPAATLLHRVKHWLSVGSSVISSAPLETLDVETVVFLGGKDAIFPTTNETVRILDSLPLSATVEFDSLGHSMLLENINLTRLILRSLDFSSKRHDPISDWKPPSTEIINAMRDKWIMPLRLLTSPVFFSTDTQGKRYKGLGHIPKGEHGPLLFVANHQFGGLDLQLYVAQLIEDRSMFVRGLGHPVIFHGESGKGPFTDMQVPFPVSAEEGGGEGVTMKHGFYRTFGVVTVSPRAFYKLMQSSQPTLLFPGGIREAFHGKHESYKLFWPEKMDFVRTAAKYNATIIPISSVGAADSANILVDAPDVAKLPFGLGNGIMSWAINKGRYDDEEDDTLHPPLFVPKPLPARHYFVFGKAFNCSSVDHKDKVACNTLYEDVHFEVERGLTDLVRARKNDPFANTALRIAYERFTGKQAPTFRTNELD